MHDGPDIVGIAALIGDPTRADILTALMADQALTATELAQITSVTKQTVSAHLAKLLDAGLLAMERQGRHRFFRLADRDVADVLERLMGVAFRTGALRLRSSPREPALRRARVCYDHLAGELGVLVHDSLVARGMIRAEGDALVLTDVGARFVEEIGIDLGATRGSRRPMARSCLDWSVRRHHLAGALGAAFLERFEQLGWASRSADSRVVLFPGPGERRLRERFTLA